MQRSGIREPRSPPPDSGPWPPSRLRARLVLSGSAKRTARVSPPRRSVPLATLERGRPSFRRGESRRNRAIIGNSDDTAMTRPRPRGSVHAHARSTPSRLDRRSATLRPAGRLPIAPPRPASYAQPRSRWLAQECQCQVIGYQRSLLFTLILHHRDQHRTQTRPQGAEQDRQQPTELSTGLPSRAPLACQAAPRTLAATIAGFLPTLPAT